MLVNRKNIALVEDSHRTADLQPALSFHVFKYFRKLFTSVESPLRPIRRRRRRKEPVR